MSKMDRNPAMLEKRALLEETSSDEDEDEAYARGKFIAILKAKNDVEINVLDLEKRGARRRN